ncbi:ROK family protein [Paenibacillus sp. FSL R7-0128]|uniref:ROK family protein n=1 Tax=Paenibacillus sp. FSL R7-0128 TaxID=2954529 RepID=UPI0030FCDF1B
MSRDIVLALDVGGTFIKTCVLEDGLPLQGSDMEFPALADRDRETILDHFMSIFQAQYNLYQHRYRDAVTDCRYHIGMAFPGPFDYRQGVCLIRGLGKFEAIYGLNLGQALRARWHAGSSREAGTLPDMDIRFENDARLFALGVSAEFPRKRFMALTLGTGLGSAFIDNSRIMESGPGIPPNGWLYDQPYLDGRADDWFSRRGILKLAREAGIGEAGLPGANMDVKELAHEAREGNAAARGVFAEFGARLGELLQPYVDGYRPDFIILGGQISKSHDLLGPALLNRLQRSCSPALTVRTAEHVLAYTFRGIARMFSEG